LSARSLGFGPVDAVELDWPQPLACGAAANAGTAIITAIAAITNATTTNEMMRLISATSFVEGGTRQPRHALHNVGKYEVL